MSEETKSLDLGMEQVESVFGEVEDKGGYYQHPVGKYRGVVGKLIPKYKNANGDKCEKDEPGATLAYAMQEIFVLANLDTNEVFINDKLEFSDDCPFGAFKMTKYTNVIDSNQYFNKLFYADFWVEGDTEKKYSVVRDNVVSFPWINEIYIGTPITFDVVESEKKKGSYYVTEVKLSNHSYTKDIIEKRKKVVTMLEGKWWELKSLQDDNKNSQTDEPVPEVQNPDDILGDLMGA